MEREAGLAAYAALAREGGRQVEPFLLPLLPQVLACHADKVSGLPGAGAARSATWGAAGAARSIAGSDAGVCGVHGCNCLGPVACGA